MNDTSEEPSSNADSQAEEQSPGKLHPRVARLRLATAKDYQAHLGFARRALQLLGEDASQLDLLLLKARGYVDKYTAIADGRIEPRRRPPIQRRWSRNDPPRPQFFLCLDECGSQDIRPHKDPYPAFCVSGVIISEEKYLGIDRDWKTWKATWLDSPDDIVHEPDVRKCTGEFYRAVTATENRDSRRARMDRGS